MERVCEEVIELYKTQVPLDVVEEFIIARLDKGLRRVSAFKLLSRLLDFIPTDEQCQSSEHSFEILELLSQAINGFQDGESYLRNYLDDIEGSCQEVRECLRDTFHQCICKIGTRMGQTQLAKVASSLVESFVCCFDICDYDRLRQGLDMFKLFG